MQSDMHYYGTYAMARAVGLSEDACFKIAYSAQFVDDNVAAETIEFEDGATLSVEATAHHPVNLFNTEPFDDDQRRVWVPFHFLPGNEGSTYSQRLRCRKDSAIAQEMIRHYVDKSNWECGLYLAGIGAHVYADTFSHYGFSGVCSRGNKVEQSSIHLLNELDPDIESYIRDKADDFQRKEAELEAKGMFANFREKFMDLTQATIAEASGALGHGPVSTYPDRPFLEWEFTYEQDGLASGHRNNQETFLEACRKLHQFFVDVATNNPSQTTSGPQNFEDIESKVVEVLQRQDNKQGRIDAWQQAAMEGTFGQNVSAKVPVYSAGLWRTEWDRMKVDPVIGDVALNTNVMKFYQAAAFHRNYVLRDLLPSSGLVVA